MTLELPGINATDGQLIQDPASLVPLLRRSNKWYCTWLETTGLPRAASASCYWFRSKLLTPTC